MPLGEVWRRWAVVDRDVLEERVLFPRDLRVSFTFFENLVCKFLGLSHGRVERVLILGKGNVVAFQCSFLSRRENSTTYCRSAKTSTSARFPSFISQSLRS